MIAITRPLPVRKPISENKLFSLQTFHKKNKTIILMRVFTKELHTGKLTKTLPILKEFLPSILRSTCFNEGNKPFYVEVLRTEFGHLFEHMLLEFLCQLKLSKGYEEATFSGMTDWNWNIDPRGTFWITISHAKEDTHLFPQAIEKTSQLLEAILSEHHLQQETYANFIPIQFPLS